MSIFSYFLKSIFENTLRLICNSYHFIHDMIVIAVTHDDMLIRIVLVMMMMNDADIINKKKWSSSTENQISFCNKESTSIYNVCLLTSLNPNTPFLFCPHVIKLMTKPSAPSLNAGVGGGLPYAILSRDGGTVISCLPSNHSVTQVSFLSQLWSHFQTFLQAFSTLPKKPH